MTKIFILTYGNNDKTVAYDVKITVNGIKTSKKDVKTIKTMVHTTLKTRNSGDPHSEKSRRFSSVTEKKSPDMWKISITITDTC